MLWSVVAHRWLVLAALVVALPLLFLACEEEEEKAPSDIGLRIATATPAPTPTITPTREAAAGSPTPTAVPNVCLENPDPAGPDLMAVEEPRENDVLTSPAHVRGWGAGIGFEDAGVQVALYDSVGALLKQVKGPPLSPQGRTPPPALEMSEFAAPFAVDIAFSTNFPQPGCLWVFELSAADGSPIHVVQIPVLLRPPTVEETAQE